MTACPAIDPAAPLQFVINAASGSSASDSKRALIEAALQAAGRRGDLHFCQPAELAQVAQQATATALASRTAVVAVGGDGTLNTVAQYAHAAGCAMGVVPQGTFNYFARTHGIPADPADAVQQLLGWAAQPVQVAAINQRVFLVNASMGLYPDLLEDREAYKARFGRSRWVAFWAACVTLLRAQRQLRLHIEQGTTARDLRTLVLFVGNNRLQLQHLGVHPQEGATGSDAENPPAKPAHAHLLATSAGHITAVMLRPIGTLAMLRLMLRGALGSLGEAPSVEHFEFEHLVVRPTLTPGRRGVKVAYDGEVARMRAPLDFRVLERPLFLLMPPPQEPASNPASMPAAKADARAGVSVA
ncbi:diacylglycerol/lipid kinase family protein [Serpentinimonas barnesii]|uniref:diacylglycerol/lipid kinase family protein n=1 Tax=Serpentinimonas barnesii TaxID=1458427 RepID=UPI0005ED9308|nr:diacylglycerol kinase family protein [Serpentinimonas barnesii]